MRSKLAIAAALAIVLALPFIVRGLAGRRETLGASSAATPGAAPTDALIVVTPHVEQIQLEFEAAFSRWSQRHFNQRTAIDWRHAGGTSEIIRQLEAQFEAAAREGRIDPGGRARTGAVGFDLFFGGGSFEHDKMKQVREGPGGGVKYRMGQPAAFAPAQLAEWFGENKIGTQNLYDPDQYWIGTALSGFGIMFNKDALADRGLDEPRTFADLCDPRYFNTLALADPRYSGSVTTTYESIMNKEGWDRGWRILRELCANTRYFAYAATRPPVDISQGEAAAGLVIDFYGRGQAQFTVRPGQAASDARVGYIDPAGAVYVDADPVSMLNGAPHPELARRFIEFCLSEEAQALWQMPARATPAGAANPIGPDGEQLGPERYELRRMPVRRMMFAKYADHFVDKANPFELASALPGRGWRGGLSALMPAFGVDVIDDLKPAWAALNRCRAAVKTGTLSEGVVASMEADFYAWPQHTMKDGSSLPLNEANFKAIYADADKFKGTAHAKRTQIAYTEFFRAQYRKVERAGREALP